MRRSIIGDLDDLPTVGFRYASTDVHRLAYCPPRLSVYERSAYPKSGLADRELPLWLTWLLRIADTQRDWPRR